MGVRGECSIGPTTPRASVLPAARGGPEGLLRRVGGRQVQALLAGSEQSIQAGMAVLLPCALLLLLDMLLLLLQLLLLPVLEGGWVESGGGWLCHYKPASAACHSVSWFMPLPLSRQQPICMNWQRHAHPRLGHVRQGLCDGACTAASTAKDDAESTCMHNSFTAHKAVLTQCPCMASTAGPVQEAVRRPIPHSQQGHTAEALSSS